MNEVTVHLVTFSDESMSRSRELCVASAKRNGTRQTWEYDFHLIRCSSFYLNNKSLFNAPRGRGYWAWKPIVIKWAMKVLDNDDVLIWADAGVEFIDNVSHIISKMDADIWLFGNSWQHLHWCKMDAIKAVCPEVALERFNKQCQASVVFFRVSEWSRAFVKEWLDFCVQPHLIDDSPSVLPNHEEFREHRHDQAILTCLAYKYGIPLHWWPAVYNRLTGPGFVYEKGEYVDTYPPLFHHHRLRNDQWLKATA